MSTAVAPRYQVPSFAVDAYLEFNDLLDFIWKSPNFIDLEISRELEKINFKIPTNASKKEVLDALFYKQFRKEFELRKFKERFPVYLNSSNLFIAASLYELHLLRICQYAEKFTDERIRDQNGQGYSKCSNFLKKIGIRRSSLPHFREAEAAIVIRNCLMHAGGVLELSKDRDRIKQIANNDDHLTDYTRSYNIKNKERFARLEIAEDDTGSKLVVPNEYAHIAAAVLRDHLISVANEIELWVEATPPLGPKASKGE